MKLRSTRNWENPEDLRGLVFFSQLIDELTYDTTLSTFKPSTLHTALLCIEASRTVDAIESGNIRAPNLDHVIAELCDSLERDPIAKKLLSVSNRVIFSTLKEPKKSIREKKLTVDLLSSQLGASAYRKACEEIILKNIGSAPDLAELRAGTSNYVTTILASGMTSKHVRDVTVEHFYGKNRVSDGRATLLELFEALAPKSQKYQVIFKVDSLFLSVADAFTELNVTVTSEVPSGVALDRFAKFFKPSAQVTYAVLSKVDARDPHAARDSAEHILRACATFLNLFHHRQRPTWSTEAHVKGEDGDEQLTTTRNAMHRGADLKPAVAARKLKDFLEKFSLDQDAFLKFMRSAQLHGLAVGSASHENQLLNLWIALESLIPPETKSDQETNIEHIVQSLTPLLNYDYIERITNSVVKDLLHWDRKYTTTLLKGVSGSSLTEKIVSILRLEENKIKRDELYQQTREFHLLNNRLSYLENLFSSTANCKDLIAGHSKRIGWQIRRIYRTRNIIVHSGVTPSYTGQLIEHAHEYLDNVFNVLIKLASHPAQISNVAEGFKLAQMHYDAYMHALAEKDLELTDDNIHRVFFMRYVARV